MVITLQMTFSNTFSRNKSFVFEFNFHWGLFPMVQVTKSALVQVMAWHRTGDKALPDPKLTQFYDTVLWLATIMKYTELNGDYIIITLLIIWLQVLIKGFIYLLFSSLLANWELYLLLCTLRPRQNGRHFEANLSKCIFFSKNLRILMKISPKFVLKFPIDNSPAVV